MVRRAVLLGVVAIGLTACTAVDTPGQGAALETFAHRTATSDLVLFWNCRERSGGVLRVEGVAQNPWQAQPIRFLELQLVGVDAQGREIAAATGKARDIQIFTGQQSPFQLELRLAGTEVRVDLYYQYLFNEEFKAALLAGPPMAGPRQYAQTRTALVRDACSPTAHLAR
jgi:hypothetical protein